MPRARVSMKGYWLFTTNDQSQLIERTFYKSQMSIKPETK